MDLVVVVVVAVHRDLVAVPEETAGSMVFEIGRLQFAERNKSAHGNIHITKHRHSVHQVRSPGVVFSISSKIQGVLPVVTPTQGVPPVVTPTQGVPPVVTPTQGVPPVVTPTQDAPPLQGELRLHRMPFPMCDLCLQELAIF